MDYTEQLLQRAIADLAAEFEGIFSRGTIERYVREAQQQLDSVGGTGGRINFARARVDWFANTACQDESRVLERGIPASREVIVTYSVRYQAGFVYDWRGRGPCTGNAKKLFFLYAVNGSRFDFISENHVLGMGSDYDHPLFSQNRGTTMSDEQLGDGQWHRITIHVR
jgi:hypothetical protein